MSVRQGPFKVEYEDEDGEIRALHYSDFDEALERAELDAIDLQGVSLRDLSSLDLSADIVFRPRRVAGEIRWLLTNLGHHVSAESRPFTSQEILDLYLIGPLGQPDPIEPAHCGNGDGLMLMARGESGRWYAQCWRCGRWEMSDFVFEVPLLPYRATRPSALSDRGGEAWLDTAG